MSKTLEGKPGEDDIKGVKKKIILRMKRSTVSVASERLNRNGKFSTGYSNRGEAGCFNKLVEKKPD